MTNEEMIKAAKRQYHREYQAKYRKTEKGKKLIKKATDNFFKRKFEEMKLDA